MYRSPLAVCAMGIAMVGGCTVYTPAPRERVVEREVVDPYGNVVERDRYVEEAPPPQVEVIPARPYYGTVWVHGYWGRSRHRWVWVRGYWR